MKEIKNHVELPLMEPLFSTYHHQGTCTAILDRNKSIRNWYLNNSISLICNKSCITGRHIILTVENTSYNDDNEENYYIIRMTLETIGTIAYDLIHKFLTQGFYVAFDGIDDYYMKGKSFYNKRHVPHDGLIYGYDLNNKTYNIYAYNDIWKYDTFVITRDDFELGRQSCIDNGWAGQLCAIRANDSIVNIDIPLMIKGIKKYIESPQLIDTMDTTGNVTGIVVHDYVVQYIRGVVTSKNPFDFLDERIFRMLWEHKKVMLERIECIEQKLELGNKYSCNYKKLVELSDSMRIRYAVSISRKRITTIASLIDDIHMLKNMEYSILKDIVSMYDSVSSLQEINQ